MNQRFSHAQLVQEFEKAAVSETHQWNQWPERLADASTYVFLGGGKRIRPVLALSCAQLFGDAKAALTWSLSIELIHTYSLVHDDLPAMDDDDERRGKPTCHRQYDEGTAVLVGDALLTRAFELLSAGEWPASIRLQLVRMLAESAGGAGMVGGQVDDLFGDLATVDHLIQMQMKKTGALLSTSAVGGAVCAGADDTSIGLIRQFGDRLGLLFQLTDDILDKTQDAERASNNFHHHMSDSAVLNWRDELMDTALDALNQLSADTIDLEQLIHGIGTRKV